MVEAPGRSKLAVAGRAAVRARPGVTRSRSRSRGVLLIGLAVSAVLPPTAGGAAGLASRVGSEVRPLARHDQLVVDDVHRDVEDRRFAARAAIFGQRMVMSKSFSPSIMLRRRPCRPRRCCTTLLTSAVITPQRLHFSGSTRNSRFDWP